MKRCAINAWLPCSARTDFSGFFDFVTEQKVPGVQARSAQREARKRTCLIHCLHQMCWFDDHIQHVLCLNQRALANANTRAADPATHALLAFQTALLNKPPESAAGDDDVPQPDSLLLARRSDGSLHAREARPTFGSVSRRSKKQRCYERLAV